MSHNNHKGGAAIYVITAVFLAILTYIEFGLIQYKWLGDGNPATILTIVALSIVKFIAVISIFMHLKDDNKTLFGFFAAGLVFAFAIFVAMSFLFTVNSTKNRIAAPTTDNLSSHESSNHNILVEEAGFRFPAGPKNQAYVIERPFESTKDYSFSLDSSNSSVSSPSNSQDSVALESFDWQELGQKTFNSCSSCHQATGTGIPGAFPPLNKNAALKYNSDREYLLKAVTFGLTGEIDVDGNSYNSAMPAWGYLSDEEIAAVLNYVLSSWDNPNTVVNFEAYSPNDVNSIRALNLSSDDTLKQRP